MTIKEVSEKYDIPADTLRYYEKVGAIPHVTRTSSGIRNYTEQDEKWVTLAKCMRSAGLPVDVLIEYLHLFMQGNSTLNARLELLSCQRESLLEQKQAIDEMLDTLNYKISRYEIALKTGFLSWEKENESVDD